MTFNVSIKHTLKLIDQLPLFDKIKGGSMPPFNIKIDLMLMDFQFLVLKAQFAPAPF